MNVCLAISSFRNDEPVAAILRAAHAATDRLFSRIIVVDSLDTGAIPQLIERQRWADVEYHGFDRNLGSAGNLAERLRRAAQTDCDFVYAVNHDGQVDPAAVRALTECARDIPRVGAVYPLRYRSRRAEYDLTGTRRLPLGFRGTTTRPEGVRFDVHWGSSNGALYALRPVREGLLPWADLWMGWEDLGYGWLLEQHGYRQVVTSAAVVDDPYEYAAHRVFGRRVYSTDKPAWYAYYRIRNLLLVTRRCHKPAAFYAAVAARVAIELAVSLRRDRPLHRYRLLLQGLYDGLRNRCGKAPWP